ncbi:SEL1-like repeat protein [Brevundimonas sp. CEF1]|uniref:tetratricopeptide repeat protein n=1 Tax=Brevundimonas sp. CEF1 TaxID=3442642 RepID=UPI003F50E15F
MSAAAPWSVKGIDPKAREIAKDLARRSGMTLGEWLNSMIMDEPDEDEGVTPLPRRTPIPDPYDRRSRSRRLDDVYGADEDDVRVGASLEIIAGRLEAAERRSTIAIQGIDQAVAGLVRRMEKQDEIGLGYARRIDDIADELREGHKRLRRFEQETGPKSEEGFARLDAALGAVSSRLFDLDERQRNTIGELRERMEAVEKAAGPGPGTDVLAQVGVRLDEAQERTSDALKGLERSFAALDQRLRAAESQVEPEHSREAARFEKLAETLTRQVEGSRVEMMRRLDVAETEGRVDRIERALAAVGDQTRAAEQRSADAVEAMGREVLRIAQNLNQRVEKVEVGAVGSGPDIEALGRELNEKLDREMQRHAQAVDQRITRSDDQHALALERLGGEITRISDRLSERIAQSERRSAQALDDISRRLTEQRHDRASGELGERMRQSEERTARLLAEARDSMEQRGSRAARRETPLESPEPTPWSPAESPSGDWRAAAFADPVADLWSEDSLGGVLDAAPFPSPQVSDPEPVFADPLDAELNVFAPAEEPEAPPSALFGSSPERARFGAVSMELVDEVEPNFAEQMFAGSAGDDFGGADVSDVLAEPDQGAVGGLPPLVDGPAGDDEDGFSADIDFIDPAALKAGAAAGRATTRDTLDAARAAMAGAEEAPRKGFGLKRGGKSKLQERLDKQASREGSTMRKALGASAVAALVMGGGYASLQLAEGSGLILPDMATLTGGAAPTAGTPEAPIAAVALDATPTEAVPSPDVAASEGAALYARGVQLIDNGDDSGLETLKRAANLGYGPAQMRLAGLYQEGGAGLTPDPVEARTWARRAAEGGEARAMHYYAMQLYDGEGGARNRVEALAWLKKAAEAGRVDSQYNVARLYEKGDEGVAPNATEAFKWYMIAARRGDQQALAAVQRLTPLTSAETRRVAREAADAFTVAPLA